MDPESLKKSISEYKEQLKQIETALSTCNPGIEKNDLLNLKSAIEELISLTQENVNKIQNSEPSTSKTNSLDDEYMLFMQEMAAEGVESNSVKKVEEEQRKELEEDLKSLEGMKCQAPHVHSWGDKVYHNALVCGVINPSQNQTFNDIQVRIMFTNPTHQEMLPCPYFLEHSNCKFSDEHCRYSHGEIVPFSSLQEYKEPNFQDIKVGSMVLAKSSDNLWHRAILRKITTNECFIKFESNIKEISVPMKDILPLEEQNRSEPDSSNSEAESDDDDKEWLIQKSLLSSSPSHALGDWEKHTKGIGSKLMQQMGYITGTGLGKYSDGRLDPVEAVVLPYGKSLDHCMNLKELAGGDENLFSVERKLKKQQKMQDALRKKQYQREKKKKDIFEFLNNTLTLPKNKCNLNESKNKKEELKKGSVRDLNVKSFKIEEDIKKVEYDICKIKNSLTRHNNPQSTMHQNLKNQLLNKQAELSKLKDYARNVKTEQKFRKEKQQMSVF